MTDLWSLTIAFRGPNTSLRLTYEGEEKARMAYEMLKKPQQSPEEFDRGIPAASYEPAIEITDSFGTTATVDRDAVMVHWMTHMGSEAEGLKAVQILNAHAQASLSRKIQADPMLKGMMAPQGGQQFKLNG